MQMAELTQSCPNLQNVFDLAALIRMRNRPVSEAIGKIKFAQREMGFLPLDQRDQAEADLKRLIEERKVVEKIFEREMQIIYAGTLLSGNPEGIYRFVKQYPVYDKGGDKDAAISALEDLKVAMSHGVGSLNHLLKENKPIHQEDLLSSIISPVFPLGDLLTYLSLSQRDFTMFVKIALITLFFFVIIFLANAIQTIIQKIRGSLILRGAEDFQGQCCLLLSRFYFWNQLLLIPDKFPLRDLILRLRICSRTPMRNLYNSKPNRCHGHHHECLPVDSSGHFHHMPFSYFPSEKRGNEIRAQAEAIG